jgi:hypothetical protein
MSDTPWNPGWGQAINKARNNIAKAVAAIDEAAGAAKVDMSEVMAAIDNLESACDSVQTIVAEVEDGQAQAFDTLHFSLFAHICEQLEKGPKRSSDTSLQGDQWSLEEVKLALTRLRELGRVGTKGKLWDYAGGK